MGVQSSLGAPNTFSATGSLATGNFRSDVNVSGSINASDIGLVPGLRSPAVQIAFRTSIIL